MRPPRGFSIVSCDLIRYISQSFCMFLSLSRFVVTSPGSVVFTRTSAARRQLPFPRSGDMFGGAIKDPVLATGGNTCGIYAIDKESDHDVLQKAIEMDLQKLATRTAGQIHQGPPPRQATDRTQKRASSKLEGSQRKRQKRDSLSSQESLHEFDELELDDDLGMMEEEEEDDDNAINPETIKRVEDEMRKWERVIAARKARKETQVETRSGKSPLTSVEGSTTATMQSPITKEAHQKLNRLRNRSGRMLEKVNKKILKLQNVEKEGETNMSQIQTQPSQGMFADSLLLERKRMILTEAILFF